MGAGRVKMCADVDLFRAPAKPRFLASLGMTREEFDIYQDLLRHKELQNGDYNAAGDR